ncbi:MAG: polymer-forming cytoskeletal protein [Agathobacter sp.]|nr:polymer-forming cytoskeletal protein [Agathobacter sp.]
MGLFKDFKEDFSQAVNELVPGGEELKEENIVVDTLSEDVDVKSELSKLDGLLEQVKDEKVKVEPVKPVVETPVAPVAKAPVAPVKEVKEEKLVMEAPMNELETPVVLDETSVITASTTLTGNLASAGSFDIQGTVNGNVSCNGKLVVTGVINGNSSASEIFADVAKIAGEVVSTGTVKIGAGSVVVGNITAASAVIAGAVKGDIDVQGPVVVDTSAVIMGNIKSRSVQINNGAIIEGFCSQCYADVDVQGLFGTK